MQAEGGLMSITGEADGPPFRLGVAISDIVTGMFAFQGIAMALLARDAHRARAARRRRHARRDGRAAHLPGRQLLRDRRAAAAARQPASDDRSVRDLRRQRRRLRGGGRQRRVVARLLPAPAASSSSAPIRGSRPTGSACGPTTRSSAPSAPPAAADARRMDSRRSPRPACRAVRCGIVGEVLPGPAARGPRHGAGGRARRTRRDSRCSACPSSSRTRQAPCAPRRRRWGSTPSRMLGDDLGLGPQEIAALRDGAVKAVRASGMAQAAYRAEGSS